MEARAINRFVGTSPVKMRLVVDLIRGRGVEEALTVLHFSPKHAARTAEKVLRSAISNIQTKDEGGRLDTSTLFVREAFVNVGPTVKRISPAPMGRAFRIRKRSHHLTIIVAQREVKVKASTEATKAAGGSETKPKKKSTKSPKPEKKAEAKTKAKAEAKAG
jgi:large subunit ribosomal protein L22